MHKISIIVPVYNVEKYLERCVNSILNQTYENKEIILVDDESADTSGRICDELAKKHNEIRSLHVKNGGPNKACMEGLAVSTGEYICFCDSDDWLDEKMLYEMSLRLEADKKQIVCCNFVIEDKTGTKKGGRHGARPGVYEGERLEKEIWGELLGHENRTVSMSRCMKLFSRELLTANTKYWDFKLRMGDDMTIAIPAILDCDRIVIMDGAEYYHYLFLDSSIVHKYNKGLYENIRYLKEVLEALLQKKEAYRKEQCEREYLYLLMLVLKNEARGSYKAYSKTMRRICQKEQTPVKLKCYPIEVNETVGKLCRFTMRYPNLFVLGCFRMLIRTYDYMKR
ncbi:glycosyl transferase family 2 [Kineothrix alysoides]|uniref:Glycosyl transferase family 2 n=1 Tax=Kineothrix alysoides TaxID=1469948 RepID=A0A4R1QYK9_9FIRM|nr:glycosyltransferase family 2 protein [Kineothrix alysoides]TCL57950.1 glycosyl transferase family 2 [Kineothrix alysoides]